MFYIVFFLNKQEKESVKKIIKKKISPNTFLDFLIFKGYVVL